MNQNQESRTIDNFFYMEEISMDIPVLTTPREILITALGMEKKAYYFYKELLRTTRPKLLKELLEQLQDEELKHTKMVEKMISRLDRG